MSRNIFAPGEHVSFETELTTVGINMPTRQELFISTTTMGEQTSADQRRKQLLRFLKLGYRNVPDHEALGAPP
jgi:hypothetical protein